MIQNSFKNLGCLFLKIWGIDPLGFDFFSTHMAAVKVFYIFAWIGVLIKNISIAQHPRVALFL